MQKLFTILFIAAFVLIMRTQTAAQGGIVDGAPVRWVKTLPISCNPNDKTRVLYYKYSTPVGLYGCAADLTLKPVGGAAALDPISVTGTTQQAVDGGTYLALNPTTRAVITLPVTCTVGKTVTVNGFGAGQWRLAQNAGQTIHGSQDSTIGTGGYFQSQTRYDSIVVKCMVASTDWVVTNSQGTLSPL